MNTNMQINYIMELKNWKLRENLFTLRKKIKKLEDNPCKTPSYFLYASNDPCVNTASSSHCVKINPHTPPDHLQWETVKERVLKAATLQKLISAMLSEDAAVDTRHFNVFFATYRAFTKVHEVLKAILAEVHVVLSENSRYQSLLETKIRSWNNVICWWIDLYPDDFREHPNYDCLTHLIEFTRVQQGVFNDLFIKCVRRRDEFARVLLNPATAQKTLEKLVLSYNPTGEVDIYNFATFAANMPDVCHVDSYYIAEQLTYYDAEIFKRLIPHQCQSSSWSKRNRNFGKVGEDKDQCNGEFSPQNSDIHTVKATVDQFNSVSKRVMSTVVQALNIRLQYRAKIISAWIDVAQELRILKNYSSLKAVLSGLQSEPVYRLKKAWSVVPEDRMKSFMDLSQLFSEDDNYYGARALLEKEGTAKIVELDSLNSSQQSKENTERKRYAHKRAKSDVGEIQGTVPYLGTFLTDLTMVDAAYPDYVEDGLINFEKRKKEFEILAQIKLFQSAARNYRISPDVKFRLWFTMLPSLTEEQCYRLSCLIESPYNCANSALAKDKKQSVWSKLLQYWDVDSKESKQLKNEIAGSVNNSLSDSALLHMTHYYHRPAIPFFDQQSPFYDYIADKKDYGSGRQSRFYCDLNFPAEFDATSACWPQHIHQASQLSASTPTSNESYRVDSGVSSCCPSRDVSFTDYDVSYSKPKNDACLDLNDVNLQFGNLHIKSSSFDCTLKHQKTGFDPNATTKSQNSGLRIRKSTTKHPQKFDESYIVKVGLADSLQVDPTSATLYKSIKLENNDKTRKLIEKALQKHQINDKPDHFEIVQLLPENEEFVLPDRANAFYAINKDAGFYFMLRKKIDGDQNFISNLTPKKRSGKINGSLLRWSSDLL